MLRTVEGHSSAVSGVAVTPDGKLAVSASTDQRLRVWDLETGRMLRTLQADCPWQIDVAVTITPDGKGVVSTSGDHALKVSDLETGRTLPILGGSMAWRRCRTGNGHCPLRETKR